MKNYIIIGIILCVCCSFDALSQGKNRVAIQTGLFHEWFDKTPIVNSEKVAYGNGPHNAFGGYLNDSWGLLYERQMANNYSLSIEYMVLETTFFNGDFLLEKNPFIVDKDVKILNFNYNHDFDISEKFQLIFGGGLNYIWGTERLFLENYGCGIFGCSTYLPYIRRQNGAINLRAGIEYDVLDWLTIYTNINFLAVVYRENKNNQFSTEIKDYPYKGEKTSKYLKENYNLKNIPSRFDLSWRFGIGINFGK